MIKSASTRPRRKLDSPETLVAIAHAAHAVGDACLEQSAKRSLHEQFGITIKFGQSGVRRKQSEEARSHD